MGRQNALIPRDRFGRWVLNFEAGHGATELSIEGGRLHGVGEDGSTFSAQLPFGTSYDGPLDVESFARAVTTPPDWGVLLVRKGGFAVARLNGTKVVDSKTGQRHVQGRTKAGGQSQQRFARRRDNQARMAFEAAADHAARLLTGLGIVVAGGDRSAVDEVLGDPRLRALQVVDPWLPVPDPRRSVLLGAIGDAQALALEVTNL